MSLLWELKVRISPDNLGEVTDQIKKSFKQTGQDIENNMNKSGQQSAKTIGSAFKDLAKTVAAAFSVGAIIAFGKKLLSLWSDLTEFESKFRVVFKGVEDEATQTFNQIADAVGRSRLDMIQYAGTVGNVIKPLWFASDEALALSENIVKLAIDVASFNNVSDTQAISAFTKALTGEREALKTLGIVIQEADVQQKALELWLIRQGQGLDKTSKALATYQLFLDNTKDAQSDAVRTADSFANQLKRLQGIVRDEFANAGRDVANESAGMLKNIGVFIKSFGGSILALTIEIAKAVGSFFESIGSAIFDVLEGLGVELGDTGDKIHTFGNVLLVVLHAINAGIRGAGLILGGFIKLVFAIVKDMVFAFEQGGNVIGNAFGSIAATIAWVLIAGVNNAISVWQRGINAVVGIINKFTSKVNSAIGTNIGKVGEVAERGFLDIADVAGGTYAQLGKDAKAFADGFGQNWKSTADGVAEDFLDLGAYVIQQEEKIAAQTLKNSQAVGNGYSTAFDSALDLANRFGSWARSAGDEAAKWAGKWSEAVKDLQQKVNDVEGTYKDRQKKVDDADKAVKKYTDDQKKYFEELRQNIRNTTDEIKRNKAEFDAETTADNTAFARQEVEAQADAQARILDIQKQITDLERQQGNSPEDVRRNNEKRLELEQELLQVQKELAQTKQNIASIDQTLVQDAQRRANLTDAQRRAEDFQTQRDEKTREFELEQQKLERIKKIYDLFNQYQFQSVEQLENLKNDKRLENASVEEQQLIAKLANERIQLVLSRDAKIQAEREAAQAVIQLNNEVYRLASQNVEALEEKYRSLISTIQAAVQEQRNLASVNASNKLEQRFAGGDVAAGTPYLVGENPDWSINSKTTELFVPHAKWSIVPAGQVQEALRNIQNVNNSKNNNFHAPIYIQRDIDFALMLERALFRI